MKTILILLLMCNAVFLYWHRGEDADYLKALSELRADVTYGWQIISDKEMRTTYLDKSLFYATAAGKQLVAIATGLATGRAAESETYVAITMTSGHEVKGRLVRKGAAGDYVLALPGSRITIAKNNIERVEEIIGEDAEIIKQTIEDSQYRKTKSTEGNRQSVESPLVRTIPWEYDIKPAITKAAAQGKLVMVDFSTTWCGWCKKLDKETFANRQVRALLNKHFVCAKIDGDRRKDLTRQYKVTGFPHILFINKHGHVLYRQSGYVGPEKFMEILNRVIVAQKK